VTRISRNKDLNNIHVFMLDILMVIGGELLAVAALSLSVCLFQKV